MMTPIFHMLMMTPIFQTLMMTPMARFGSASELADVYCYLAGDESSFVTGIDIEVAGGLAI